MSPAKPRSAKQAAAAYFDAIGNRDLDGMEACWKPGGFGRIHGMVELRMPKTYRPWFGNLFQAFPDFEMTVIDMVAYGDKAAVRWGATGTFTGPAKFEGLAPTGRKIAMEGLDLLTVKDGLITENYAYTNAAELARQLGAMPAAGSVAERATLAAVNARTAAKQKLNQRRNR